MKATIIKRNLIGFTISTYDKGYQIVYKDKSIIFNNESELVEKININDLVFVENGVAYLKVLYTNDLDTAIELAVDNGYSFIYDWKREERIEI